MKCSSGLSAFGGRTRPLRLFFDYIVLILSTVMFAFELTIAKLLISIFSDLRVEGKYYENGSN